MSDNHRPQTVITGIGILSPIGIGIAEVWDSLSNGKSGIARVEHLAHIPTPDCAAGEVRGFTAEAARKLYLQAQRKSIKVMCREIQLGVASANLALEHSGLDMDAIDHQRLGVDFGANLMFSPPEVLRDASWECVNDGDTDRHFQFDRWGLDGLPKMEPLWLLRYLPNMPACHIGISADARGPNNSITLDEASGNLVLGETIRIIRRGGADIMISGTTGTRLHPVKSMHAKMWDELATTPEDPTKRCRPFDADRQGEVVAEGASSLIVESESHAKARNAKVIARVLGTGSSCVIGRDLKANNRQALVRAMNAAFRDGGIEPGDIGHVNAHGQGSRQSDVDEAAAIREVFKDIDIPVTAFKSYTGSPGSGCGTIEIVCSIVGLQHGVIPKTLNYERPDPDCPVNVVHGDHLPTDNKMFLSINVTRMGQASAAVIVVE
ncbi:MAG: beta-ketoacyl-[acyl-carrier-protein] synthase family protein [Planctomycetota bacterium]|nr:beta-ketoacyl-[acyl-carrier-protein] synthase family protein [Planctomycetota bacterium]